MPTIAPPRPPFQRLYSGPTPPTAYDPSWNSYTNLTPELIADFEAFPQDLTIYAGSVRWGYENRMFPTTMVPLPNNYITVGGVPVYPSIDNRSLITAMALDAQLNSGDNYSFTVNGTVYNLTAAQAIGLFNAMRSYVQQCRDIEAALINGINATPATITLRSQIDAAFAVLA